MCDNVRPPLVIPEVNPLWVVKRPVEKNRFIQNDTSLEDGIVKFTLNTKIEDDKFYNIKGDVTIVCDNRNIFNKLLQAQIIKGNVHNNQIYEIDLNLTTRDYYEKIVPNSLITATLGVNDDKSIEIIIGQKQNNKFKLDVLLDIEIISAEFSN